MKVVILLCLVALAAAQQHGGGSLMTIIEHEVHQIIAGGVTDAAVCFTQCDALFNLAAGHDEELTDRDCQTACNAQLHVAAGMTVAG